MLDVGTAIAPQEHELLRLMQKGRARLMPEQTDRPDNASSAHSVGAAASRLLDRGEHVSVWLVAVVVALLVAVLALGGYVLISATSKEAAPDTASTEVEMWEAKAAAAPDDLSVRLSLGYAYQQEERFDEAVEQYDAVLEREPKNLAALYNRGVSLIELGRGLQGEKSLERVLEIAPAHELGAKTLAEYYRTEGRYAEIEAVIRPAAEANPQMADLHALLGIALEKTGDVEGAAREYREALRRAPDLALAKDGLARIEGGGK